MRIIAGQYGGRIFDSPKGHLSHPMSEKMRGAIFSSLGDISGLSVLDAYSGSGAICLEAISRGAKTVVAIDNSKQSIVCINQNIANLKIKNRVAVVMSTIDRWLANNIDMFDLIIADPPYDQLRPDIINNLITRLHSHGLLVLSWPGKTEIPILTNSKLVKTSSYGDSQLAFYNLT